MASPGRFLRHALALLLLFTCRFAAADELPVGAKNPSAEDLDLAKAHFQTGELNYAARKFADAAKEFEESYRLSGRSELLFNMGKCYDNVGDMRGALLAYRTFMQTVKESPDRPFVQKRQAELENLIARIEIKSSVPGSNVMLDGQRVGVTPLDPAIIEVNPGNHTVEISAEGYSTYRQQAKLDRSQTQIVDAKLISLVKVIHIADGERYVPIYKRWYVWTAVGIVLVAGAVTGGVLGARAADHIDGAQLKLPEVKAP